MRSKIESAFDYSFGLLIGIWLFSDKGFLAALANAGIIFASILIVLYIVDKTIRGFSDG